MKRYLYITLFLLLTTPSCEKDYIPGKEDIPGWVQVMIEADEASIKISPKCFAAWGGWVRYVYENDYYYEYKNVVSSKMSIPVSFEGDSLDVFDETVMKNYFENKCCHKLVWQGPLYIDFD